VAGAGGSSRAGAATGATGALRLVVRDLPLGVSGRVVVSGPRGFRRILARSTVLHVASGRYRVSAVRVRGASFSLFPSVSKNLLAVGAGKRAISTVSCLTRAPDATKVAAPGDVRSIVVAPGGARVTVGSDSKLGRVVVGDVVVVGPAEGAEGGYAGKVTGVTKLANGAVLSTRAATLTEVIPSGALSLQATLQPSGVWKVNSLGNQGVRRNSTEPNVSMEIQ